MSAQSTPLAANTPAIRAESVVRVYGRGPSAVRALDGVSLTVEAGKLTALKGRSGSGKTTLLNLLGGLDRPTCGTIWFEGVDLNTLSESQLTRLRRHRVGYVFQSLALVPLLTARENVELPLRIIGLPARVRRQRAEHWLTYVALRERMNHRAYELSGGEQQRVAIARALATEPAVVLADEPTGELDSHTGIQVIELFARVAREAGVAICLTTHDPAIVELADVVYSLADGSLEREA